jgi:hypothetical protein
MADELGGWYVRARGRILGPFTWAQLESLRDRGQLARFHEVSKDRQAWMGAAGLAQLFAPSDAGAVSLGSAASSAESTDSNGYGLVGDPGSQPRGGTGEDLAVWFYARDGTHQGPLPIGELRRMAGSGEIDPYTLVWTKGMPNWIPANQVPELGSGAAAGLSSSGPAGPSLDSGRQAPLQPSVYQPSRTSGLAVASLVLGILWLCGLGSLLATIFGAVALSQISRSRGQLEGKGLAIAGLVLGIIGMSLFALPFFTSYLAAILHSTAANRL